ncbi:hypothetical protein M0R45_009901 [Rubus argutus]|uniref:Uncharacterized protein n=1 Tax=Rubus argutus TaxID=59490 RepID=A0AAW1Y684_RUBAR
MKDNTDSKTLRVTASTSLSLLMMVIVSWSLWTEEKVDLFAVAFRFSIALRSDFFTVFLVLYAILGLQQGILGCGANIQEPERAI